MATVDDGESVTVAEVFLDGDWGTVVRARQAVHRALSRTAWHARDSDVGLVVGELATNAMLHGDAPVRIRVRADAKTVRIEVSDGSRVQPVRPPAGGLGLTGRGLALVAATATRWGVEGGPTGKTVWAEIGDIGATSEATFVPPLPGEQAPAEDGHHLITLGDVPTDLLLAAKNHVDGLVREFALAAGGAASGTSQTIPPRLAELLETAALRFAVPREAIKRQAVAAAHAGMERTHLELALPLDAADAGEQYLAALEEIESYARAARLLTVESPPQHVAFRRWYVGSLVQQLRTAARGHRPRPVRSFEQYLLDALDEVVAAQRIAERAARLQRVTAALAVTTSPEQVAQAVVSEGVAALGAFGGGLLIARDAGRLAVPGTVGYREDLVEMLRSESIDDRLPAADAIRVGRPVWLESRQDCDAHYPELAELEPEVLSMCALPLIVGDRVLGALRFSFDHPRLFDADERDFVLALAAQTAFALERARLFAVERQTRERSAFLAEVAEQTSSTLDARQVVEKLTRLLVPRYGERAVAILVGEKSAPVGEPTPAELAVMERVARGGASPLKDGEPFAVPLWVGGSTAAVVAVSNTSAPCTAAQKEDIEEAARRAAIAVGNARQYEQERGTALTLQRILLPRRLPTVPGLTFAWRYLPATAGALVGGDWYDVIPLDDGRVVLVVGDVMGHGIEAAAVMGQLRASARAYATSFRSPGAVLARLDDEVNRFEQGRITTVVLAVLEPTSGCLTFVSAGHLPPLLVPPRGAAYYLPVDPGPPLGAGEPEYPETALVLEPGSTLLFFTDGLIEDRSRPLDDGMRTLRERARATMSPAVLCDTALAALGRVAGHDDDIALLAVTLE